LALETFPLSVKAAGTEETAVTRATHDANNGEGAESGERERDSCEKLSEFI